MWKNREKVENFHCTKGKNIILEKGEGKKYQFWVNYEKITINK